MDSTNRPKTANLLKNLSSVRLGIILLIVIGIISALGTFVLQRPLTDPAELQQAYSSQTLRWLDRLGFTDVFHSWGFAALLALLATTIVLASIERFPVAWHYFARPYRRPAPHFMTGLKLQNSVSVHKSTDALEATERAFRRLGFKPQRVEGDGNLSLYAERNRIARLAPYIVHASLLLIFAGAIGDSLWGYRGFVALQRGQQSNVIELRDGSRTTLPFALRCNSAGQQNYEDGTPRRWWSDLTVVEAGRDITSTQIEVNKPLTYGGVRFYQASFGRNGQVEAIRLGAKLKNSQGPEKEIRLIPDEPAQLDSETTVQVAAFVPDFVVVGNQIQKRSDEPRNPAIELAVESKKTGEARLWLFPNYPDFKHPDNSAYEFQFRDVDMGYYTGLQVSHEPGQWAVWTGVILMGFGLALSFYFVHVRVWAVPVNDSAGRPSIWLGASASKNREEFEERFANLVNEIDKELDSRPTASVAIASGSPARI